MSRLYLRTLNKTVKGNFAFIREVALVATDHQTAFGTGVLLRLKIYIPGRKMLVGDFVFQEFSPRRRNKVKYHELQTRIQKLCVLHVNTETSQGEISGQDIEQTCSDLEFYFSKGKPVSFEEIMTKLEFSPHELRPFTDSARLEAIEV